MTENGLALMEEQGMAVIAEKALITGDLSKLSSTERLNYYQAVCRSLGLNPLTKPFDYITLNGKLKLYAKRDCTDQLRRIHNIAVTIVSREQLGDVYVVTAKATMPNGRTDESIGAVAIGDAKGDALANALMKSETKAKRRVTLSIVGLGMLDETEVETVPGARVYVEPEAPNVDTSTGEVLEGTVEEADQLPNFDEPHGGGRGPASDENILSDKQMKKIHVELRNHDIDAETANAETERLYGCRISDLSKANASKYIELIMAGQAGSEDPDALCDEKDIKELTTKAMEVWGAEAVARTELTKLLRRVAPHKKLDQLTRGDQRAALREMGKMQESADRAHAAMI